MTCPVAAEYVNGGKQATVTFELDELPQNFCNGMNNLHGGAVRLLLLSLCSMQSSH